MDSLEVKNLRSISSTGKIDLKPITILVGANSTGKSTFLRCFPLFKQGISVRKRGPILWYGTDVDYGSYKKALKFGRDFIQFDFTFSQLQTYPKKNSKDYRELKNVTVSMSIKTQDERDYINEIKIGFNIDQSISILLDKDYNHPKFNINGQSIDVVKGRVDIIETNSLLPAIMFVDTRDDLVPESAKHVKMMKEIMSEFEGYDTFSTKQKRKFVECIHLGSREDIYASLCNFLDVEKINLNVNDDKFKDFNNLLIFNNIPYIIDSININMKNVIQNISYIKPMRASAERYYRIQNLAIKDLDSDGHNMAMFIHNLSPKNKENFTKWTNDNFGFSLKSQTEGEHISLLIADKNSENCYNIADKGFGYSQILPIIIILWQASSIKQFKARFWKNKPIKIIAIEQPALHLHPNLQAKVADALINSVKEAKKNGIELKYIIETHSQTIINRIGARIANKDLSCQDVTIALFDENVEIEKNVRIANYTNEGFLNNWPIGFFAPEFN